MGRQVRPWFQVLVERGRVGPFGMGLGVASAVALLHVSVLLALHTAGLPIHWDTIPHRVFIYSTVTGYTFWFGGLAARETVRALEALRPHAAAPAEFDAFALSFQRVPFWGLVAAAAASVPMAFALVTLQGRADFVQSTPDMAYHIASVTLLGTLVWPWLYVASISSGRFWLLGRHMVRVNVLDLDALAPFARVGMRTSLGILGSTPLIFVPIGLVTLSPGAWIATTAVFAPAAGLAVVALLAPAWGVHRALQQAKAAELERVRRAISGDASALSASPIGLHARSLSIVELLDYRDRIESLREWPFDSSMLRRFGLYLLIPLGSWIGAALVERGVDFFVE